MTAYDKTQQPNRKKNKEKNKGSKLHISQFEPFLIFFGHVNQYIRSHISIDKLVLMFSTSFRVSDSSTQSRP